jgi:hypothetical protein
MKLFKKAVVAIALLLVSGFATADTLHCSGTVTNAIVYAGGALTVRGSWRSNYTMLCNVETAWSGIGAETCRAWSAEIQEAVISGHSVTVYYNSVNAGVDCSNLATYGSAPAPAYVMIKDH